jgi:anti-anti-sigma regulatory factor
MTLRIEKVFDGQLTTLRLIGRLQAEHLDELTAQIKDSEPRVVLDLAEVSLVDVEAVRFLGICQAVDVRLVNCSPFIRDWIAKEQHRGSTTP